MYVVINKTWIIPKHLSNAHVSIAANADCEINIYLPEFKNGKMIKITQNSNQDIRVYCNSNVWLETNKTSFQCLVVTGAECNRNKTINIIGRNNKWSVDTSKINFYTEKE
jgi:hypothetical protein